MVDLFLVVGFLSLALLILVELRAIRRLLEWQKDKTLGKH